MIIHGNKQISGIIYSREALDGGGAVALTNIIRGAQVVFGGLAPSFSSWLSKAARQAILGAFGHDDGWQVIGATNRYLNGIAATDPTKAQALAALLNEDPMMVCSLGLEVEGVTMPIRYIQNSGMAWINTEIVPTDYADLDWETYVSWQNFNSYDKCLFAEYGSSYAGSGIYGLVYHDTLGSAGFMAGMYNQGARTTLSGTISRTKIKGIKTPSKLEVYVNDVLKGSGTVGTLASKQIWIFVANGHYYGSYNSVFQLEYLKFISDGVGVAHFVPCVSNGVNGLYDIDRKRFFANANTAGTLSIAYRLPDGTPWTPQTP
jgi:hypothetical protein